MAVLQSTNVQGTLCVNGVAVGGGKDFKYCCFTASTTWTPSQDLVDGDGVVDTTMVGGGGAGGYADIYTFFKPTPGANLVELCNNCAGLGGGSGVGQFITNISATDACTVTVGAGGEAYSDLAVPYPACMLCVYNQPNCYSASVTSGGDSSFGGNTVYGGGGGSSYRRACYCEGSMYNFTCVKDPTRNGACLQNQPGGAENTLRVGGKSARNAWRYFNADITPFCCNNATFCVKSLEAIDPTYCYGTDYCTAPYQFYPAFRTKSCFKGEEDYAANAGEQLGGKRVGTAKGSVFDGVDARTQNYQCICTNGNFCTLGYTGSSAINCGGGGGTSCLSHRNRFSNAGGCVLQQGAGGPGGDGLVILKWFE